MAINHKIYPFSHLFNRLYGPFSQRKKNEGNTFTKNITQSKNQEQKNNNKQ